MTKKSVSHYSIRQVIELTGVSEFTLRGWELRYKAVSPRRTPTGRRLYTHEDLLKIKALKDLVDRGHRIGAISSMQISELQKLIEERELLKGETISASAISKFEKNISQIIQNADRFEWFKVKNLLEIQQKKLAPKEFIENFLVSLMRQVSYQVHIDQFSITQEHILTAFIKECLYAIRANAKIKKKSTSTFVMTTPEGDIHELGLLMASTLATLGGIHILYLGPNVPKADICEACLRFNATHLLLSSTVEKSEGAKEDFLNVVNFIDRQLPNNINLWIAGRHGQKTRINLKRKTQIISTLEEFGDLLAKLAHAKNA